MIISSFRAEHDFLSNFYENHFYVPGSDEWWLTAEHAFQAAKADSRDGYLRVVHAATPAEAKKIGRQIPCRRDWDFIKRKVMLRILMAKFDDPGMAALLASTGDAVLVEGNTWGDDYWGAVQRDNNDAGQPAWWDDHDLGKGMWYGHNWLGRLLMMVREAG